MTVTVFVMNEWISHMSEKVPAAVKVTFEVEPYVDVNPTDTDNIVGGYQQDRYSNGGAKGVVASVSLDGGASWTQVAIPAHNRCTGPTARFERATDPWVSFGPDGAAHFMTLSIDPDPPTGGFGDNAMVYNRSTNVRLRRQPAQERARRVGPGIARGRSGVPEPAGSLARHGRDACPGTRSSGHELARGRGRGRTRRASRSHTCSQPRANP